MADQISNNESILVIQQLQSIQTTIQELSRKQDIQNVKLFGEDTGTENPMGRLPQVEVKVSKHESRLERLEKFEAKTTFIIAILTFAASTATYAILHHFFGA